MSVRTLLPFCSPAQARSLEEGSNRSRDAQVLPVSTVFLCAQVLPVSIMIYNLGIDIDELVARCPDGMSGADVFEVLRRIKLKKAMLEVKMGVSQLVSQSDIVDAIGGFYR